MNYVEKFARRVFAGIIALIMALSITVIPLMVTTIAIAEGMTDDAEPTDPTDTIVPKGTEDDGDTEPDEDPENPDTPEAPDTITLKANGYQGTYDGNTYMVTVEVSESDAAVEFSTDGGETWSTTIPRITNAGTINVKVRANKDGFEEVTAECTLHLDKANLTFIGASAEVVYKGNTYNANYNDGSLTVITPDGLVSGHTHNLTYLVYGRNVGTYTGQFKINGQKAQVKNVVIQDADGADVTGNYSISLQTGTLTITQRSVTFSGVSSNETFTGEEIELTDVVAEGLVKGHTHNVTYSAKGTVAGEYPGSLAVEGTAVVIKDKSGKDVTDNYAITLSENPGTLTIVPANTMTITATGYDGIYDGQSHAASAEASVAEDTTIEYSLDEENWSAEAPGIKDVGQKTVYVRATNANYETATDTCILNISPAPLKITAESDTKVYDGDALTKDSYTHTDLVEGDMIESVTITGSQTGAGSSANIPSAAVIKNGDADVTANYEIEYVNGTLTVTQADPEFVFNTTHENQYTVEGVWADQEYDFGASATSTVFAEGEREQYSITYSVNVEEDYAVIDNDGKLTVKQPCELTVTASFAYNGEEGGANFTDAEITFSIEVISEAADHSDDDSAGTYMYFDPEDENNTDYVWNYTLGENNGTVSTATVKKKNSFDFRQATYSLKDHTDALSINARSGEVKVTDYASLAAEMQESDTKSISVRVFAHLDKYGKRYTAETISYTIIISFAEWPEEDPYQISEATGNPVTDTEETAIVPNWYTELPVVTCEENYSIALEDIFTFNSELTIDTQGEAVNPIIHLQAEDGGITEAKPLNKVLYIDTVAPDDDPEKLYFTTREMIPDTILDTISLGFYQGSISIIFTASDDTSGVDYVEWKYTKSEGVSDHNADSTEWTRCDFNDGGELEAKIEGDARGTISFKVYDKAGNCTEWNDGEPSGVFVLDSIAPVFVSAAYNDKTIDQSTYFFNQSDLNETAGGNTVTAEFIIKEANFFGEDPVVTINGETINGQKPETEETIEGNVEWQRKEGTEEDADNYTGTFTFSGDGYYHVGVTYTDRSGNVMEPAYQSETIVIDTTLPVLDPNEIDYGTEADTVKEEGIHYYGLNQNGQATITLKITENNFIAGGVTVMVNGVKTAVEEWQHDGSVHTGSFTISGDGEYKFTVGVTDAAGNAMEQVESETIIIDTVRPIINVSYSPNDIVNSIGGVDYYKTTQIATVTFTEDHFDGGQVTITGGRLTSTSWDKKKEGDNQHTATVQFDGDEQYKFSVNVTDKAGNAAHTYSHSLTVDKTPPSNVSVTVDRGTVDETIQNVIFFKDQVLVTVSADDQTAGVNSFSFVYKKNDEASMSTSYVDQLNKFISGTAITQNGNRYSASFYLPRDAAEALQEAQLCGTLSVTATDRSGNAASGFYRNTVVLDTESPKISVEFTVEAGNDPAKETADAWYFNNNPVGTITIDEANFYPQQVRITATKDGAPYEIQISDWKKAENGTDKHIGTFTLTEEGDYIITVEYTDGSGNKAQTYSTEKRITVDTKIDNEPKVTINGQTIADEDGGVYAGAVEVAYEMSDLNLDREKCTIQVLYTPSFEEKKDVTEEREYGKQDFSIDDKNHMTTCTGGFTIIEETEAVEGLFKDDGIYDLIITMTDLAGNEASKHVQFAVCRHGSVYRYDEYFAGKIGNYLGATNEAINKDVVIYEYCPTDLATEEDTIIIKVYRNIDEEVAGENDIKREAVQQDPNNGWYQYKYVIDKKYFAQDGEYKIFISSAYKAMDNGNASVSHISSIGDDNSFDNRGSQKKGEAWFVVDTTAPDISSVVNLDKASVNADSLTVNFTVEENYGIQSVEVLINDQVTETKLEQVGSTYSYAFDIPSGLDEKVVIRVTDTAGNVTDTSASDFTKSINDRYKFKDTITVSSNPLIRWYANKPAFWGTIGGVAAAAGGLGTAAVVRRRKKGII